MAVYCQQSDDGVAQDVIAILNKDELADAALLARKAASAERNGWAVVWHGAERFCATKVRGIDPRRCVRHFWIGA